ncbi:hypothetical protein LTS18_010746, partial [Coniosporium uncinatum]
VAQKDFKGLEESTYLSRAFADQGVRLKLRKEPRAFGNSLKRSYDERENKDEALKDPFEEEQQQQQQHQQQQHQQHQQQEQQTQRNPEQDRTKRARTDYSSSLSSGGQSNYGSQYQLPDPRPSAPSILPSQSSVFDTSSFASPAYTSQSSSYPSHMGYSSQPSSLYPAITSAYTQQTSPYTTQSSQRYTAPADFGSDYTQQASTYPTQATMVHRYTTPVQSATGYSAQANHTNYMGMGSSLLHDTPTLPSTQLASALSHQHQASNTPNTRPLSRYQENVQKAEDQLTQQHMGHQHMGHQHMGHHSLSPQHMGQSQLGQQQMGGPQIHHIHLSPDKSNVPTHSLDPTYDDNVDSFGWPDVA